MRGILKEMSRIDAPSNGRAFALLDMEAGLEQLKRGTPRHTDVLLVVAEPFYRSLETAARTAELGLELGVQRVGVLANKVRDERDEDLLRSVFDRRRMEVLTTVPFDESVVAADRVPGAVIDVAPDAPAVRAISEVADALAAPRSRP